MGKVIGDAITQADGEGFGQLRLGGRRGGRTFRGQGITIGIFSTFWQTTYGKRIQKKVFHKLFLQVREAGVWLHMR